MANDTGENLRALQLGVHISMVLCALILLAGHFFPSLRAPGWTEQELTAAIVFALLAIASKP